MKIRVEFNNPERCSATLGELRNVARETIARAGLSFLNSKRIVISVAAVNEEAMRSINRTYRHKDAVTDVLSFAEYSSRAALSRERATEQFLGEIVICCKYIEKSAKLEKRNVVAERRMIVAHGVLHLLGFRHGKTMFSIQETVGND